MGPADGYGRNKLIAVFGANHVRVSYRLPLEGRSDSFRDTRAFFTRKTDRCFGHHPQGLPQMLKRLILAAVLLAIQIGAASTSQSATLTLVGSACSGHAFTGLTAKYDYNLTLASITVPTGCADTNIRISKLYIDGTCASTRNNAFT